ncbi:hypothetical protein [Labedaea rhizosphaerae]|uniref:Uncharacterized protein n=1 Tax=Labedaea rhizosphaerae TaxID=598644 RepID=A0A4R6SLI7_LABRH|nr:hypothetical protein [Labedaea rhizosphaerae]TDQ04734.1 hypothetical protein EV186_101690 [Labedaea rhizosphaerae]
MTEPVWLDGTQDLPPQPLLPDPLAGLLTGEALPGVSPESWQAARAVPPPPSPRAVAPGISAVFAEPQQPRGRRQRAQQPAPQVRRPAGVPAAGYRPRPAVRQRPPRSGGRVVLITWIVTLFILFLIARAVITGITGN